jgi:hypothetical protein
MEDKVIQWNIIAGNDPDDKSLIETYKNLCIEEAKELESAQNEGEVVDAIIDSIYTGFFLNILTQRYTLAKIDQGWVKSLEEAPRTFRGDYLKSLEDGEEYSFISAFISDLFIYQDKYDILGAFERVTQSNFSKFAKVDTVDIEKEIDYIKSQGRYDDIFYEKVGDYIVFRATYDSKENKHYPKGKIMKPSTFISVEDLGGLSEFIY